MRVVTPLSSVTARWNLCSPASIIIRMLTNCVMSNDMGEVTSLPVLKPKLWSVSASAPSTVQRSNVSRMPTAPSIGASTSESMFTSKALMPFSDSMSTTMVMSADRS